MRTADWNPRFVAYATAHGRTLTAATPITDAEHAAFDAWLDEIARKHRPASVPGAAPGRTRRRPGASIAGGCPGPEGFGGGLLPGTGTEPDPVSWHGSPGRPHAIAPARTSNPQPGVLAGRTQFHTTAGHKTPPVCVRPEAPPRTLAGQAPEQPEAPTTACGEAVGASQTQGD